MKFLKLFKEELAGQVLEWAEKGLISNDQARKILAHEGLQLEGVKPKFNIVRILGGLALGVGVIILLKQNWHEIPSIIRVVGLVVTTAIFQYLGVRSLFRQGRYGSMLVVIAALMFGARAYS
ncbi:MAG: DUF2157 domain-containing protein [Deltaproteobacteria bacterium]|nr:DUF2157 domain-containing protein [Deltaproteobacteria bacterium]